MSDTVILVDEKDVAIGSMSKMEVHRKALLHRAFSIFIFNSKGDLLLQQRALNKYHSGGLWTNTCCSHPGPGETVAAAAAKRLQEEMGFTCILEKAFVFTYKAEFDNGLCEHEMDHVFVGTYDKDFRFNPAEVQDCCYKSIAEIGSDLQETPGKYTVWFQIAFPKLVEWLNRKKLPL
jgi:isopentenyl-diphosphate delta-isomerase